VWQDLDSIPRLVYWKVMPPSKQTNSKIYSMVKGTYCHTVCFRGVCWSCRPWVDSGGNPPRRLFMNWLATLNGFVLWFTTNVSNIWIWYNMNTCMFFNSSTQQVDILSSRQAGGVCYWWSASTAGAFLFICLHVAPLYYGWSSSSHLCPTHIIHRMRGVSFVCSSSSSTRFTISQLNNLLP